MSRTLTVTLETVTPLFLGGADPRGAPELRAPAFRGALRYWLRAAQGGVLGGDLEAVRKAEAAVFGSTDEKSGGASAIAVRIHELRPMHSQSFSALAEAVKGQPKRAGLAYLLFAARGTQQEKERSGLWGGSLELTLGVRPGAGNSEGAFTQACAAVWLLTHLGALGARSRRGAGAIQVVAVGSGVLPVSLPPLPVQAATPGELVTELREGIKAVRQIFGRSDAKPIGSGSPTFDVIHPSTCRVWVIDKTYPDWKRALDEIGTIYQQFRNRRSPDYETVKTAINARTALRQPVQRAAFGLPIPFYYRSLNGLRATLATTSHDRRSSPLWIRPVRLTNDQYAITLVWFRSQFLDEKLKLEWGGGQNSVSGDPPEADLIETFLLESDPVKHSSLKDGGLSLQEVIYA